MACLVVLPSADAMQAQAYIGLQDTTRTTLPERSRGHTSTAYEGPIHKIL